MILMVFKLSKLFGTSGPLKIKKDTGANGDHWLSMLLGSQLRIPSECKNTFDRCLITLLAS